ncbi:MAG: hypothetical protein MUC85_13500, partial [Anaerolineales bacterium]|nr:hypothetical protein [Anaerolineales bacterium]
HPTHELHQEAAQRLADEIKLIQEVIAHSRPFRELFESAEAEMLKPGFDHQFTALHIFRYLSGAKEEKQKDWPEYRLSLKTAEARSKAQHLAEKLRTTALGEVLQAYRSRQSLPQPSQVRHLAEVAAELRQAYLFESREERDAAQWIEVEKAKLDHSDYERLHKWDEAVELWQHLDLHYPRQSEIQTHLHTSQIQQALLHADMALTAGQGNEALNILWEAQREPSLSRSIELNLKLAEVYAGREEFDKAFEILDNQVLSGNSVDQAQAKKTEYQKEQALLDFIHRAEAECKKGRYRHALKILLEDSQTDKRLIDHPRLSEKAAQVFTARSDELTARIEEQNKLGSYPAKVNALNAALELRSLEEAMHVTGEDSTALQVIGDLRSELSQIAFNLVQKVNSYDLNGKSLEDALEETQNAVKQLEAFESIKEQFKDELDEQIESLRNALQQARTRLSNLMALEEQIEKTKAVAYWEQALTQGKFTELDSIKVEIDRINLVGIVEVDSFATKVSEYSALSKHFDQARNNITKLFIEAEDFEGVKKHIARLRSRPPTYRQENKDVPFKQIQQGDYDLAYELVGNHFNLVDLYSESGKNLSGWQVIQDVATRREADYQAWKAWADVMQEWEQKARERTTKLLADHASPPNQPSKVTLRKKKKDYSDLLAIDRDGLEKGKLLPHRSETPVPVQSEKADQQKKAGSEVVKKLEESKKWAEAMIQEIDQEITSLGGFPTQEEVAELFKTGNDVLIGKRFRQGMQIGTETEDEEKRLRMMRLKMSAPAEDEGGLVKKLKGIFGKKNQEGE